MKKLNLHIIYTSKKIQCKMLLKGSMCEPSKKNSLISDEYEYSNKTIFK